MSQTAGFTLIEILVTIAIVGVLLGVIGIAYPSAREQNSLLLAQQQLQAFLREAQQKAINEEREAGCLAIMQNVGPIQNRSAVIFCSDIGVHVREEELIMFADTNGANRLYTAEDYVIKTEPLVEGVRVGSGAGTSFLFDAVPPTVNMFANNRMVTGDSSIELVLEKGRAQTTVKVYNYGHVSR